eukprot:178351-Rhodomonas_salina.1
MAIEVAHRTIEIAHRTIYIPHRTIEVGHRTIGAVPSAAECRSSSTLSAVTTSPHLPPPTA